MKQFNICISLSLLFHILCSFLGGSFNPMEWGFETERQQLGKTLYVFIQMCIWLVPIYLNYLIDDKNFSNEQSKKKQHEKIR